MDEALARLQKARTGLVIGSPFFGSLALQLEMKVDQKSETAFWIDGTTIGVHPDTALNMPMEELEGMLARATLHAALGHPLRREGRDPEDWNTACAHVAGLEVKAAGMHLPEGSPADPQYAGMTAPQVYAMIAKPPSPQGGQSQPQQGQGQSGGGSGAPQPQQKGSTPPEKDKQQPAPGEGDGGEQGEGEGEAAQTPEEGSGEVRDHQGDAASKEEESGKWQEAIAQAAQLARGQGLLPGNLERMAMKEVNPLVDWREALQRFFKARTKDDYSWTTPSRRWLAHGIYFPTRESVRMGKLVFAVDMSGSVGQTDIDQFFSEIEAVRQECRPEGIIVLPFDSAVREAITFEEDEEVKVKARAGGGTDFKPAVEWCEQNGIVPEALVYLTDLECSSFPDVQDYPLLWVTTRPGHAPHGDVIEMVRK